MVSPRGPLPVRRMTAHWVVLAAAALTTLVATAVGAALAVFAGQALPRAVRHDLTAASGTAVIASGTFPTGNARTTSAELRSAISAALPGVPLGFWRGTWSDPLGFTAGALPAKPASLPASDTPLLAAASLGGIAAHAVLVAGAWPSGLDASAGGAGTHGAGAGPATGGVIPAALPAATAALLRLRVGDVLRVQDRNTNARLAFKVTGLYAQRQLKGAAASYWQLNTIGASGTTTTSGFTTYGPLVVAAAMFPGRIAAATGTWVAQPDMAAFSATRLSAIAADVSALQNSVANSNALGGMQVTTSLPTVLTDTGNDLSVARSLLAISGLQLLVLALAGLLAVARLLATQREGETALLAARGATRWQLARLTAAEAVPLAVVTAAAGAVAGIWLARWLGSTLYDAGGVAGGGVSVTAAGTWLDAAAAALVVAVLSAGAILYPVLRPVPAGSRVRRGRQAVLASATRAGADLALVALAVLAGWQLRRYSAVSTSANGTAGAIDPVLVLAPALALAGGTVLTLRLLPAAARATDRLAAGGRRLTGALAGWQFSRQPLRQGGAALLLVMAVATGTLALAQHASWARSASDQAAHTAGADVRVDLGTQLPPGEVGKVARASGVRAAMAVSDSSQALPANLLALDASQGPAVTLLRPGQSSLPLTALFRKIMPARPAAGAVMAGTPSAVRLTATLSRAPVAAANVLFTLTDATGAVYQVAAQNPLPADGRAHVLSAPLGGDAAVYPLRLTQIGVSYPMPARPVRTPVTLTIGGIHYGRWNTSVGSPELDSQLQEGLVYGRSADPQGVGWQAVPGGARLTFNPGYGRIGTALVPHPSLVPAEGQITVTAAVPTSQPIPAIATRAYIDASHTSAGATLPVTVEGVSVQVKIAAVVSTFPTVPGSGLIVGLKALNARLTALGDTPVSVTQWWLATDGGRVPPALTRALPPGAAVTSSAALAAATVGDPLSAAPQQALLAMAIASLLLAVTGFWVSIAANVRQRRAENALLAALGVNQRSAAAQLFLEKLLLSVPSAVLGLVLGMIVASLLVPAVTLTSTARQPVPPPVTLFDLSQTLPLAAAIAVIPALAAALVVFRRPDPAAELRAAEAT